PCVGELPEFYDVYKEYSDRVEFLFVNIQEASDEEHVKAFLADNGYELPLYFDPSLELQMRFDVTAIPTTVFIDACGEYEKTQVGSMSRDELIAIIEDLIPKG
ncbi:MAG: TlpA disulfide reductase family protein, partial [Eubacteriales bacterium]|nr:TlpA disulfide reductase family protein [Eubacteriales bacterium]